MASIVYDLKPAIIYSFGHLLSKLQRCVLVFLCKQAQGWLT
jgi:hypothetical protein